MDLKYYNSALFPHQHNLLRVSLHIKPYNSNHEYVYNLITELRCSPVWCRLLTLHHL